MALDTSLAAYFKFDEPSGASPARDYVGGNVLTPTGAVTVEPGLIGYGRHFPGEGEAYLSAPSAPELVAGDRDFTLAVWCRPDSEQRGVPRIVAKEAEYQIAYPAAADRFRALLFTSTGSVTVIATDFGPAVLDAYHLLVFRVDRTAQTVSLSVNAGPPTSASTGAGVPVSAADPFYVGGIAGAGGWHGLIGELWVWHKVLSEAEEDEVYASGLAGRTYPYPPPDPDRGWQAAAKPTVYEATEKSAVWEAARKRTLWEAAT